MITTFVLPFEVYHFKCGKADIRCGHSLPTVRDEEQTFGTISPQFFTGSVPVRLSGSVKSKRPALYGDFAIAFIVAKADA